MSNDLMDVMRQFAKGLKENGVNPYRAKIELAVDEIIYDALIDSLFAATGRTESDYVPRAPMNLFGINIKRLNGEE